MVLIIVLNSIEWNKIFKHHVIGIRLHDAYFVDEGGERKNRKGKYLWIRKVKLQLFQITTSSYAYLKCTKKKCIIVCVRTNLRLIKMQKLDFFEKIARIYFIAIIPWIAIHSFCYSITIHILSHKNFQKCYSWNQKGSFLSIILQ